MKMRDGRDQFCSLLKVSTVFGLTPFCADGERRYNMSRMRVLYATTFAIILIVGRVLDLGYTIITDTGTVFHTARVICSLFNMPASLIPLVFVIKSQSVLHVVNSLLHFDIPSRDCCKTWRFVITCSFFIELSTIAFLFIVVNLNTQFDVTNMFTLNSGFMLNIIVDASEVHVLSLMLQLSQCFASINSSVRSLGSAPRYKRNCVLPDIDHISRTDNSETQTISVRDKCQMGKILIQDYAEIDQNSVKASSETGKKSVKENLLLNKLKHLNKCQSRLCSITERVEKAYSLQIAVCVCHNCVCILFNAYFNIITMLHQDTEQFSNHVWNLTSATFVVLASARLIILVWSLCATAQEVSLKVSPHSDHYYHHHHY